MPLPAPATARPGDVTRARKRRDETRRPDPASASAHAQHQVIAIRHISTPRLTPLASRDSRRPGLAVMILGRIPYIRTSSHLPNAKISHGHQPVPMMEMGSDAPDAWIAVATEPVRAAGRKTRDDRSP
ncbi:hypothetical protein CPLU01_10612 [Colletotrichum plurivorum]|uniref:Uncharacterized protein n=1 Tax=Colletotrichum plurivorum TaxID=2175906 RepID=A0A8H6K5Z2_9PEZI|nr:hypothetical protein CPLU01_10612 [Colletotrichum plurivorum]